MKIQSSRRSHAGAVREAEYAAESPLVAETAESIGGEQGLGSALRRFITAGLYNSDFGQLPEDITQPIDDVNNPLPYWSFVRVAGATPDAYVVADASSASGYVLRFSMTDGTADDEAYIEQIVPINGSRGQSFYYRPVVTVLTGASVNGMSVTSQADWLKVDAVTTTGVSTTNSLTTTLIGASTINDRPATPVNGPPADAYYLRVRFGFKRAAEAVGSSGLVDFCEARVDIGPSRFYLADSSAPATWGPGVVVQTGSVVSISGNQGGGTSASVTLNGNTGELRLFPGPGSGLVNVVQGTLQLSNDQPSTLTGAQDNVAITGNPAIIRWNGASGSTWTGLAAGADGQTVVLMNVTAAQTLILSHDVTSTAANRFYCPNNAAVSIRPNGFVILVYDSTSSRWRVMGA